MVLVFEIGFGPPIAENKNLKNYVNSDLNDIFGPQFVRPPKTPLVLQPWLPLAISRTGGIVTVITNKSSSESIMLCWTEHKLVRELSAITAGFARKAITVPREHMFKSAKKSIIYIVS